LLLLLLKLLFIESSCLLLVSRSVVALQTRGNWIR
jgi:hypothetical protein